MRMAGDPPKNIPTHVQGYHQLIFSNSNTCGFNVIIIIIYLLYVNISTGKRRKEKCHKI